MILGADNESNFQTIATTTIAETKIATENDIGAGTVTDIFDDLIIPHEHLIEVNKVHKHKAGGMTFYDIKGRGRTKYEPVAVGRGVVRYVPEFVSRTKIEVLVPDSMAKPIIDDILKRC